MREQQQQQIADTVPELSPNVPYLEHFRNAEQEGPALSVWIESYGCQMNFSDTEIVYSIMESSGFTRSKSEEESDIIFLNTCAIRDKAEVRIWNRLAELKSLRQKQKKEKRFTVGVLGCMAERLKTQLLEDQKLVDIVAGPDAYRYLPQLLAEARSGQQAINVMLSSDETYADISPVRVNSNGVSAYVSIMRGCNNMCTYCIVPFTRGRERSRPWNSIVEEVKELSRNGYKEVILLGQNVNSYNDTSSSEIPRKPAAIAEGFTTIYKRPQVGVDFTTLVDEISRVDPEMRIRFTSPHPKDFPDELLHLISTRHNIAKILHMPAQSGSSEILNRMRRGYTREAYLELIQKAKAMIPGVSISSDFISGFCGETEEEHEETLSLLRLVEFDEAFMFAYSEREKTPAHRKLKDDVEEETKKRRLQEVIHTFYSRLANKNRREVGSLHLILVEGKSKKSGSSLKGRSDTGKKVVFRDVALPTLIDKNPAQNMKLATAGDYVIVHVKESTGVTLIGEPIAISKLTDWHVKYSKLTATELLEAVSSPTTLPHPKQVVLEISA